MPLPRTCPRCGTVVPDTGWEGLREDEKRQNAFERALLVSWSGEVDGTEQAIGEAELAGVSVDRLRMLRGWFAMNRGDYRDAVQQLEQASRLAPDSIAVQSMLKSAYIGAGQWEKSLFESSKVLVPTKPEDFLFKGSLEAFWDPARALNTLNETVRRRPTGIARLAREQVLASLAQDRANPADAAAAIADANAIKAWLPGNPVALALSLRAQVIACLIYEQNSMPEERAIRWREATADAMRLEEHPRNFAALSGRLLYLQLAGEDSNALARLRADAITAGHPGGDYLCAVVLYRHGRIQEALEMLGHTGRTNDSALAYVRPYVLAESPGGVEAALKDFREHKASIPPWRNEWYQRVLDYYCDALSAEDLVKAADSSHWNLSEAHFFIGLDKLAEGDRPAARDHFQKGVDARVIDFFDWDMGKALLVRLENDPDWPPWIPVKQDANNARRNLPAEP